MNPTFKAQCERIFELDRKRTQGEWASDDDCHVFNKTLSDIRNSDESDWTPDENESICDTDQKRSNSGPDMAFIASAPTMVGLLREAVSMIPQWQDIASAPTDGSECLMRFVGRRPYVTGVKFKIDSRCWVQLSDFCPAAIKEATHWQPLPAPPVSADSESEP